MTPALLTVRHLSVTFAVRGQRRRSSVHAVADVDLEIPHGQTVAVVGESGCGKSTTARAIVGLLAPTTGTIELDGRPLPPIRRSWAERRSIQMVFQDPTASLNPRRRIGASITEPLCSRPRPPRRERQAAGKRACIDVGLEPAVMERYPHELSGGQRQRVALARALISEPRLLICDEPTSNLDLSVQAQILNLLQELQRSRGLAILLITHDLAVVRQLSTQVAVMYLGRIVEHTTAAAFFSHAAHPYSQALLAAMPGNTRGPQLLAGDPPSPLDPPSGCAFHPRCHLADQRCRTERPALRMLDHGLAACHHR